MQHYTATKIYTGDKEAQINVASNRCVYGVWITDDIVTIVGPGVNERLIIDELPQIDEVEDLAIFAVILFENGNT